MNPTPTHTIQSMHNITRITLTGADERTPLDGLQRLVETYPGVEIGLLYTANPDGRNRYPSLPWIHQAARSLSGRVAIHVCGGAARNELLRGELRSLTAHAPRVQVNGHVSIDELPLLARQAGTLITQHNEHNAALVHQSVAKHSLLIDASGGRGISPTQWDRPVTTKPVGRAGGLGPHNLLDELENFAPVAEPGSWVDMENRLRTNDWFDIDLALRCAAIFYLATVAAVSRNAPS